MKKNILLIVFLFFSILTLNAQDSPRGMLGKGEKIIIHLYNDMWQGADSTLTVNSFNPGFAFCLMNHIPFGKSKISLNIGIGIGSHNLHSDASPVREMKFDSTLAENVYTGNTVFDRIPGSAFNKKIEYDVNKLSLSYVDVPIELKFTTENKKGKDIKFAIGFKAGYLINSHTKYRGDDYLAGGEDDIKFKSFRVPNIEPLRCGATVRFNYGMFGIFGYYSLSKIFKTDKGVELYPISVGISLAPL